MLFEIKHRYDKKSVLFSADTTSLRAAVEAAIEANVSLSESNLSESDLSESNLSESDLSGSNLRGSNLSGSDLRGSNLSGSNLSGSNLSGSDLSGSDLSESNLSESNLSGSDLRGSNLSGSDLSESNLGELQVAWHIHHGILWEPLTEPIENRIAYIKSNKPTHEQATRLRLLKKIKGPLPDPITHKAMAALHQIECPDCPWDGSTIFPKAN